MNRREFLGAAAAAAVSLRAGAAEPAGGAPNRIKIGLLGGGHSHAMEKAKLLRTSDVWELAGICEEDAKLRAAYEKMGVTALSQEQLLRECRAVAVESNVKDHYRHARLALEAGKHIHLEKPPAETVEQFKQLLDLAEKQKLLMQMGYMWRHNPGINRALEAARKGWLGRVYLVRGTINTMLSAGSRAQNAQFPGGTMFELGCHLIDPLVRLLGRAEKITPFLKKHGEFADELADNTLAVFEYPKALGLIGSSTLQPGAGAHRSFEIFGTNGTVAVKPIEQPTLVVELAKAAGPYAAGKQTVKLPAYQRYVGELAELAECINSGKALSVTPAEDLMVHEMLLRACERDA